MTEKNNYQLDLFWAGINAIIVLHKFISIPPKSFKSLLFRRIRTLAGTYSTSSEDQSFKL